MARPSSPGQHQVEHHQVVALARELLVHAGGVGHRARLEALLGEVAHHQLAQALVVVDDEDSCFQLSHATAGYRCVEYTVKQRVTSDGGGHELLQMAAGSGLPWRAGATYHSPNP